jgi:hypothetical protein
LTQKVLFLNDISSSSISKCTIKCMFAYRRVHKYSGESLKTRTFTSLQLELSPGMLALHLGGVKRQTLDRSFYPPSPGFVLSILCRIFPAFINSTIFHFCRISWFFLVTFSLHVIYLYCYPDLTSFTTFILFALCVCVCVLGGNSIKT